MKYENLKEQLESENWTQIDEVENSSLAVHILEMINQGDANFGGINGLNSKKHMIIPEALISSRKQEPIVLCTGKHLIFENQNHQGVFIPKYEINRSRKEIMKEVGYLERKFSLIDVSSENFLKYFVANMLTKSYKDDFNLLPRTISYHGSENQFERYGGYVLHFQFNPGKRIAYKLPLFQVNRNNVNDLEVLSNM